MIYSREQVRKAVARALLLDPTVGQAAAIAAAAQALGLPVHVVAECCQVEGVDA